MNLGEKVLIKLKNEISKEEYNHYIKNLKYDTRRSKDNILYFTASNIFIAKWINSKYKKKIAELAEIQTNQQSIINIMVYRPDKPSSRTLIPANNHKNISKSTHLNPSLTFDSFIVGDSNQFATAQPFL